MNRTNRILITITKGISKISAREVEEITGRRPEASENTLTVDLDEESVYRLILWGRTIYKVIHVLDEGMFTDLDELATKIGRLDFKLFGGDGGFALRTSRYGDHSFTSLDANRVVGASIYKGLKRAGYDVKVDLTDPRYEYILRIVDENYVFGINLSGESLHIRGYRVWSHPAALKNSLAAAMILLSGFWDETLIDPMAGGGTIPIEAALYRYRIAPGLYRPTHPIADIPYYGREGYLEVRREAEEEVLSEGPEIIYNDISCRYMLGGRRNAESAGVDKMITFMCIDARSLSDRISIDEPSIAVTNPPYGIRGTRRDVIPELYKALVEELDSMGVYKIVSITSRYREMKEALLDNGYEIRENLQVLHGKLTTRISLAVKN